MPTDQFKSIRQLSGIFFPVSCLLLALSSTPAWSTDVQLHKNPQTGLLTWTAVDSALSLELIQLLPDFVRATYESHGFPEAEIENISSYCVFGTIMKNTSPQRLEYRVDDWYYLIATDTKKHRIRTKPEWLAQWRKAGINFSWTIFPNQAVLEVGDWQQGFTTLGLPHGSTFDLIYSWKINDRTQTGKIKNLRCAPNEAPIQ